MVRAELPAAQLDEVIVTATKRETNLQETPVAITAFSQTALDQNLVVDITDTAKFVPGVAFASHGDQAASRSPCAASATIRPSPNSIRRKWLRISTAFTRLDRRHLDAAI